MGSLRAWLLYEGQAIHICRSERPEQDRPCAAAACWHVRGAQSHVGLRRDPQLASIAPPCVRVLEGQRCGGGDDVQLMPLKCGEVRVWAARCWAQTNCVSGMPCCTDAGRLSTKC